MLPIALVAPAFAHSFRPYVLEVTEVQESVWVVHTTVEPPVALVWPTDCAGPDGVLRCDRPWPLTIDGLTHGEVVLRILPRDGPEATALLTAAEPSFGHSAEGLVFPAYLKLGVEHIVFGFDHLAFVLGLLLLVRTLPVLLATVTAFTVAHSVTLAAAALAWVSLPQAPVEASIAVSIVLLAREVVRDDADSLLRRAPWVAALGFGLLHGFGFAGALSEIGLPKGQIPAALVAFNVGVEIGQVAFVALLGAAVAAAPELWRTRTALAYAIGVAATAWTIERVGGFWSLP